MLIIDCDPGIDDAIAILTLAGLLASQNTKSFTIVATWGNVGLDRTYKNALICAGILNSLGFDVQVARGYDSPLEGEKYEAEKVHGKDGLAGKQKSWEKFEKKAKKVELEKVLEIEGAELIATGPLSSVARYIEKLKPKKVVWMGGAFFTKGNTTEWAEFNAFCDPKALLKVVRWCEQNSVPLTIVPLDATEKTFTRREDFHKLIDRTKAHDTVKKFIKSITQSPYVVLHDPLAVVVAFHPEVCDIAGAKVHVDDTSFKGMTRATLFPGPVTSVACDTDTQKFFEIFLQALDNIKST